VITVIVGAPCCEAAMAVAGQRKSLAEVPYLPLDNCTMPNRCKCHCHKHPNRGLDERRQFVTTAQSIWSSDEINRRENRGRRHDDN
jgi:hypothetical protein